MGDQDGGRKKGRYRQWKDKIKEQGWTQSTRQRQWGTWLAEGQQDVSGLQISGYMLPNPIKGSRSLIDADRPTRGW